MTITLTPQNFEEKMKVIYSQVIESNGSSILLTIDSISKKNTSHKKSFQEQMNDPENVSYGPFENMNDAVAFLNRDL